MARAVHDDIDAFSSAEDRSRVCGLLCALVSKVDFGKDVERTLDTLAVLRQGLCSLDEVKVALVERYLALAGRVGARAAAAATAAAGAGGGPGGGAGGGGAPLPAKALAFLRAVFSAAAVTIPAIDDPLQRLRLCTAAASCALAHGALAQADALFRAAIGEIPELPAARAIALATAASAPAGAAAPPSAAAAAAALDQAVAAQVGVLAAAVLPMPGHPELGGTYLARGLLAALGKYPWSPSPAASPARPRAALALLALAQGWLADPPPYAPIPGVDSNAVLYAGDGEHRSACTALHRAVLEACAAQLGEAAERGDKGVALEGLCELLEPARVRRALACDDSEGACRAALGGALGVLRGLAPAHPAIAAAVGAMQ